MNSKLEIKNGNKIWINVNGEIHRTDGPAMTFDDGTEYWYLNGNKYNKEEWHKQPEVITYRRERKLEEFLK